jgi:hypothetical protein
MTEADTFTCALCGETKEKGQTDDEAAAEFVEAFGREIAENDPLVCDDCYERVMTWRSTRCGVEKMGYLCERTREPDREDGLPHEPPHAGWTSGGMLAMWGELDWPAPFDTPGVSIKPLDDVAMRNVVEELAESEEAKG